MQRLLTFASSLLLVLIVRAGCSAAPGKAISGRHGRGGSTGSGAGGEGGSAGIGVTSSSGNPVAAAHLKGKVVAPEGTIPISGALVYVAAAPPRPSLTASTATSAYLDSSIAFTTTAPDGTFDLGTSAVGKGYLVVQKGAFRRVRELTVAAGEQEVPRSLTTMPSHMDKANGDDIPKIAIVVGAWDPIELVLARMGLEAKISQGPFGKTQVLSRTRAPSPSTVSRTSAR